MTRQKALASFGSFLLVLLAWAATAHAGDISGTISSTLTIMEDSRLVGPVTCTVNGAPCIAFGASGLTLDLNGFSMTGLGNSETGCSGGPVVGSPQRAENGIEVNAQTGATIRGPGVVQRFRGSGIFVTDSSGITVTGVTASTNCLSGILVGGGSGHRFEGNVAVRNGNGTSPCGGI